MSSERRNPPPKKSVIVTGGASGIGKAAVLLLAEQGHKVTIADLNEAQGEEIAAAIKADGGEARFIKTNVADEASARAMVAGAVSAFGRLDGAINAAGVEGKGNQIHELSLENWNFNLAVNLSGMFLCMKHQLAAMMQSGGGSIVAISSTAAVMGMQHTADYCASKAGVTGLVRSAAIDYAEHGIRVNAILPGRVDTPMVQRIKANIPALVNAVRPVPMNRAAQPAEIAAAATWLVSDASSYVTGACISVDGGMTIA